MTEDSKLGMYDYSISNSRPIALRLCYVIFLTQHWAQTKPVNILTHIWTLSKYDHIFLG